MTFTSCVVTLYIVGAGAAVAAGVWTFVEISRAAAQVPRIRETPDDAGTWDQSGQRERAVASAVLALLAGTWQRYTVAALVLVSIGPLRPLTFWRRSTSRAIRPCFR